MTKSFSKRFIRFNWVTLVLIYLVVIAGSFVRVTGSGMGCPDWPKCFGQYIPPTEENVLPENYREIYSEKRIKKVEKFKSFLSFLGLNETVKKLDENKADILKEERFNAKKTWTEYINRLLGALAGLGVFFVAVWILLKYRKRKLILLSTVNVILLGIQAWFGSIVVATNLVPWTITVHLFLALVIIGLQLLIIRQISEPIGRKIETSTTLKWLVIVSFLISFGQMFLGTQVREYIDALTKLGFGREDWSEQMGSIFFIHRSFSWLVLILLAIVYFVNRKSVKSKLLSSAFILLAIELSSGVLLAYFDLPGLVQIAHLLFATIIFGVLFIACTRVLYNVPSLQRGES